MKKTLNIAKFSTGNKKIVYHKHTKEREKTNTTNNIHKSSAFWQGKKDKHTSASLVRSSFFTRYFWINDTGILPSLWNENKCEQNIRQLVIEQSNLQEVTSLFILSIHFTKIKTINICHCQFCGHWFTITAQLWTLEATKDRKNSTQGHYIKRLKKKHSLWKKSHMPQQITINLSGQKSNYMGKQDTFFFSSKAKLNILHTI